MNLARPTSKKPFTRVNAFVDWNSQLILAGVDTEANPREAARLTLNSLTRRISALLNNIDAQGKYLVLLRLYHGWRKGFEATANYKAVLDVVASADFSAISRKPNVTYLNTVEYGDCLILADSNRLHRKLGIHLPNTVRDRGDGRLEEKLVDTAIATDLVVKAYGDPMDWYLVVAEDDDLIPPLFAIDVITKPHGAKSILLRSRKSSGAFYILDGLISK